MPFSYAAHIYATAAVLTASTGAIFDIRSRRIPNALTGSAIVGGLAAHTVLDGWSGLATSFEAGLLCGLVFFLFFLAGGMGAGDVKLLTALGCMMGTSNVASLMLLTALSGGVLAVGLALFRGRFRETLTNMGSLVVHHCAHGVAPHPELNLDNPQTLRLPYGVAIASGSILTVLIAVEQGGYR